MKMHLKTALVLCFAILSGAMLVYTSQRVHDAQRTLRMARAAVQKETQTTRMLQAEWAFLSAPDRLEKIAGEKLDLEGGAPRIIPSFEVLRPTTAPQMHDASFSSDAGEHIGGRE